MKDKQKMKVILVVVVAIAVVLGVLSIPYCICVRTNLRGNLTSAYPLWKKYCKLFDLTSKIVQSRAANKMMCKKTVMCSHLVLIKNHAMAENLHKLLERITKVQ